MNSLPHHDVYYRLGYKFKPILRYDNISKVAQSFLLLMVGLKIEKKLQYSAHTLK